jgi:leader peptidase (prepilin peptidase)/N-methyltransferase
VTQQFGVEQIIVIVFLAIGAIQDIRKKQIALWLIGAGAAAAVCVDCYLGKSLIFGWTGLLPGGILAALSIISKGAIGFGDALAVAVTGLAIGWRSTVGVLFTALMFAGIAALFCIVVLKKGKKEELPFLPFLLAAYGGLLCI